MKEKISKCNNCNLCLNQPPLLDNLCKSDIIWVGLSAKRIDNLNKSVPLDNDTNTGRIIQQIEKEMPSFTFYKTNLVKCLPLDENQKLRYPNEDEMNKCINNLLCEIEIVKPKKYFC